MSRGRGDRSIVVFVDGCAVGSLDSQELDARALVTRARQAGLLPALFTPKSAVVAEHQGVAVLNLLG
ncbi:MAG: hypothetical protein GY898_17940 [Proteobacteria bacterium]|nr:hypothetical protein [Actinomycetes bacterium]MCP4870588.1 hypothetical protein [Pseudomonadota bacterium]